jgi:hypothetical protein
MIRGRLGFKVTFGDDLGGLIFLFTRGGGLSFPFRSIAFSLSNGALADVDEFAIVSQGCGIQFEANYFFLETGD